MVYQAYKSLLHCIYHLIFTQWNTLCSIKILCVWVADARLTQAFATASITGANYCPDAYYVIMLVVRYLLTQRSSYY